MKRRIDSLITTIFMGNILISLVLYAGILLPLAINSKVSVVIFPIAIVIHNIIFWSLIIYLEKYYIER